MIVCLAAEERHFPNESNLKSDEMKTSNADEDGRKYVLEVKISQVCKEVNMSLVYCAASSYTEYLSEHMECLNAAPPVKSTWKLPVQPSVAL